MENTLFDIEEYTDPEVRRIMQGNTCRHCVHRVKHEYSKSIYYCDAHASRRTSCGLLKIKANPYFHKNGLLAPADPNHDCTEEDKRKALKAMFMAQGIEKKEIHKMIEG